MEIKVHPPRQADLPSIVAGFSEVEVAECAAYGHSPITALELGVAGSVDVWVLDMDGVPSVVWGITPVSIIDRTARPWLLGADGARRARRLLVTLARAYVRHIETRWPRLENWVAAENVRSIRWLKMLGFAVDDELTDIGGLAMRRFHKGF